MWRGWGTKIGTLERFKRLGDGSDVGDMNECEGLEEDERGAANRILMKGARNKEKI